MLATLVIGLREGLEASLIVGIVAAFLRRNGRGLGPMWLGVGLAAAASVAVGIALWALEGALPQAQQEALETVIGVVAVVFVTAMLLWMNRHARSMRRELESSFDAALHDGGALALAGMAFLAVLKEGFETSVFLLATFRAAQDQGLAAAGAVLGVAIAVGIGWGIYAGGVRLDLGRFFRITGVFLVLVAAGLVLTAVRTAHEAGWIVAGQQRVLDLGWLAANGTLQGALVTGLLGVPADPRLLEVVAWAAYLVPVALLVYWPAKRRPGPVGARRLRWAAVGALVATAAVLALAVPSAPAPAPAGRPLAGGGEARLGGGALVVERDGTTERVPLGPGTATSHAGVTATERTATGSAAVAGPATVTPAELAAAAGGRLPVGVDARRDPGPYAATWRAATTTTAWTAGGVLVDAARTATTVLTVTGGGLDTPRTVTVTGSTAPRAATWRVRPAAVAATAARIAAATAAGPERALWGVQVPVALLLAAAVLALASLRGRRRPAAPSPVVPAPEPGAPPMPSSDRRTRALAAAVLVPAAVALLAACSGTAGSAPAATTAEGTVAPVSDGVSKVAIDLVSGAAGDECRLSSAGAKAGPVTFTVTNTSATGITEVELLQGQRIVGEKENLAPGLAPVSFTSTLTGTYAVLCPGAATESVPFIVTGKAPSQRGSSAGALLAAGTRTYGEYVTSTLGDMVTAVQHLQSAVESGDVAEAKRQYALARPFYEKVESDVEGFVLPGTDPTDNRGNLDYLVDMRASNLDPAVGWSGFHAIERDLWEGGRITPTTKRTAAALTKDVTRLVDLASTLTYKPEDLANGAAGLLEEVQSGKIKGEEERYSHLDLVDFAANVEGAEQAFANLQPGLAKIDPALTKQVADRFAAVKAALAEHQDPAQPGGYARYTAAVRERDAQSLSQVVQSLQEPLSKIAEKVATA